MRIRLLVLLAVLTAATGFTIWWFSPAQVVTRKTHKLLETLSLAADSGDAPRQLRSVALERQLAAHVLLKVTDDEGFDGPQSRSDLLALYSALCKITKASTFKLQGIQSLQIQDGRAEMTAQVSAHVELSDASKPYNGDYPTRFVWQKSGDHGWQLSEVHVSKP